MKLPLAILLISLPASAAEITSTRESTFDWQAQRADGTAISNHARFDTAFVACLANPACVFVQGGKYRIGRGTVPTPPVLGTATLTWTAPTQNTDGTPIMLPITYRIEYGKGDFSRTVSTTASIYVANNLDSGTWQFRVFAVTGGIDSAPTPTGTKVIP